MARWRGQGGEVEVVGTRLRQRYQIECPLTPPGISSDIVGF